MPKATEQRKPQDAAHAVALAISNPIRVDILSILQEGGAASQKEIASQLRLPLSKITHHMNELIKAEAIEVAFTKKVGNVDQHFWRAITTSSFQPEDLAQMTREEHEMLSRIIVQSMTTELLAALRAGLLAGDEYAATAWDRLWLDEQGYRDLNENTGVFFDRAYEIAAEAAARMAKSGEAPKLYIAGVMAFQRARKGPNTAVTVDPLGED